MGSVVASHMDVPPLSQQPPSCTHPSAWRSVWLWGRLSLPRCTGLEVQALPGSVPGDSGDHEPPGCRHWEAPHSPGEGAVWFRLEMLQPPCWWSRQPGGIGRSQPPASRSSPLWSLPAAGLPGRRARQPLCVPATWSWGSVIYSQGKEQTLSLRGGLATHLS